VTTPEKPIPRAKILRPATAALLVTTFSCVTECSEGDGHLRSMVGLGSFWLDLHAMPAVWMLYFPDGVELVTAQLPWMLAIVVLTLGVFAAFERFGVGVTPWQMTWFTWCASWIGTLLPFPFLFLGFFAPLLYLPMLVIGLLIELYRRRRARPAG
jgi:hypothetical protein